MPQRYRSDDLVACTSTLFARAGLDPAIAAAVAEALVEADLLGYDTHGLQFVPAYLAEVEAGRWTTSGMPVVLRDHGSAVLLDGRDLPGQWVMSQALELASDRSATQPLVAVSIRRSQNISCLAVYVRRAALAGRLALLTASAPTNAVVAPHGGRAPRLATNPLAVGIPTDGEPVLIDTSTSSTTNRRIERTRRAGERLPQPWLVDADGRPSDDPDALYADPPGAILPAGGLDQGHKGFALGLMVEALTSGLAGLGRSDPQPVRGNTVFLQLIDPEAFAGADTFRRETGFLAAACRSSPPLVGGDPVRVPGDRAAALYAEQRDRGVALHPEIMPRLQPWFEKLGVAAPEPVRT